MPLVLQILLPIAVGVVCAVIAFIAGSNHRKHTAEAEIGSAEQEAKRLVNEAIKTAEAKKKETILEGKDEIHRLSLIHIFCTEKVVVICSVFHLFHSCSSSLLREALPTSCLRIYWQIPSSIPCLAYSNS